jgi:serine/threonine-protein phosphatase 2B catalytic subunit
MVYTIFSAPNYCGSYGNFGAILTIKNSEFKIRQFKETNPKYYVP